MLASNNRKKILEKEVKRKQNLKKQILQRRRKLNQPQKRHQQEVGKQKVMMMKMTNLLQLSVLVQKKFLGMSQKEKVILFKINTRIKK